MKTDKERLRTLEERTANMMSAMRILQRQVIVLTQNELARMTVAADPVAGIKENVCRAERQSRIEHNAGVIEDANWNAIRAERQSRMEKHPSFGDD